jgi:hypothetical protein
MKEDEKIDFGVLDPSRDELHWHVMMRSVTDRAIRGRRAPRSIPVQLISWARPTLAIAAALTMLVWVGALLGKPVRPQRVDLDQALSQWQTKSDVLAAEQLMQALGDVYGYQ